MAKRKKIPENTCIHCGERMTRTTVEWEDGTCSLFWACACKPDPKVLKARDRGPHVRSARDMDRALKVRK